MHGLDDELLVKDEIVRIPLPGQGFQNAPGIGAEPAVGFAQILSKHEILQVQKSMT
jgi:hypothetical protein